MEITHYLNQLAVEIHKVSDPEEDPWKDIELYRLYAVLLLAKGTETTAEDVHNAWAAWESNNNPTHWSLVPFANLPTDVQRLDDPYVEAIHAVARLRQ